MRNSVSILSVLVITGLLIPEAAMSASVNSTGYSGGKSPKAENVQYIRPPKKVERRSAVTPYGDFCTRCSKYGTGSKTISMNEAIAAMKHYFKSKGLNVRKVKGKGRFLKAEIYRKDLLVDRVLFDRRTGRIRSIY